MAKIIAHLGINRLAGVMDRPCVIRRGSRLVGVAMNENIAEVDSHRLWHFLEIIQPVRQFSIIVVKTLTEGLMHMRHGKKHGIPVCCL